MYQLTLPTWPIRPSAVGKNIEYFDHLCVLNLLTIWRIFGLQSLWFYNKESYCPHTGTGHSNRCRLMLFLTYLPTSATAQSWSLGNFDVTKICSTAVAQNILPNEFQLGQIRSISETKIFEICFDKKVFGLIKLPSFRSLLSISGQNKQKQKNSFSFRPFFVRVRKVFSRYLPTTTRVQYDQMLELKVAQCL